MSDGVWVEVAPGRKRLVYPNEASAGSGGRLRKRNRKQYDTHAHEMYAKVHGQKSGPVIVEELNAPEMKKHWPKEKWGRKWDAKYGVWAEGPLATSNRDLKEYCALSRQIMGGRGFRTWGD